LNDKRIELETRGKINLDYIHSFAETSVDYIAIGALTKTASRMPRILAMPELGKNDRLPLGLPGTPDAPVLVLADGLAYFECRMSHTTEAGDHKIAVCEAISAAELNSG
jgi:hypothetical protein